MRKFILFFMIAILTSCTFEAGKISQERKDLYDRNNSQEFCEENPDKCVNGIPWM